MDAATGWLRPGPTPRQRRTDLLTGVALAVGGVLTLVLSRDAGLLPLPDPPSTLEQVLWMLAVTLPLGVRRRFPLAVLVVVATAFIALQLRSVPEGMMVSLALYLALYTAGAWGRDRRVTTAARGVVVAAMFAWLGIGLSLTAWNDVSISSDAPDPLGLLTPLTASVLYNVLFNVVYFAAAWIFGDMAWRAAAQRQELADTNEVLRASQAENARRAVLAERVRLARELHDVVAHHVSVMGVQAGAARRVLDADPEAARGAIRAVEDSSRTAVSELRRLLGVLREDDGAAGGSGPDAPAPLLADLPALVARVGASGLQATYETVGPPRPVPDAVGVSAYRVAQEALTNVVRHAAARSAQVRLRYLDRALEVEVVDDGRGTTGTSGTAGSPAPGGGPRRPGGHGLVGMAERVALHDGLLDVGPRPTGGFRVRARFPLDDA